MSRSQDRPPENNASAAAPDPGKTGAMDRRRFMGAVATAGAGAVIGTLGGAREAQATVTFPKDRGAFGGGGEEMGGVYRSENDLYDCEVEGELPADLNGIFFRVGPDPQYPKPDKYAHDIPFDGEGHLSMFRFQNGHVDFRSRYARTQRWKAQHEARRSLFGMYRNKFTDDASVANLSRGTANTQIFYHHGLLLALKEDSPPVAVNPLTLETVNDYYTFNDGLAGQTFTAHPKIDPVTGELVAFGYEAKGLASDDIFVFSADKTGKVNWSAWVKVPYVGMIHDFGVTQKHILFYVCPLATNMDIIKAGGPHFAWDSTLPTWLGVMRRGGDGRDLRWFQGPGYMATHGMGAWSDGEKVYFDMDGGDSNQFPFFPQIHEKWDPVKAQGRVMRFTVNLANKRQKTYDIENLYPGVSGALSRQDDRFHTVPYRYGYLLSSDRTAGSRWAMFDHQTRTAQFFGLGPDVGLAEMCFVPRKKGAPEGDGYLIGVASRYKENGRSDLVLVDTRHLDAGPVCTVKMPYRVPGQIHGFWVPQDELPASAPV
ncbi:MAG TPA: carotenoid oxygenase family protein [Steroidobacteraceae bacterium]|nr:carotenoid oxygenase family protein [Steroidobacteraceae bacterium]